MECRQRTSSSVGKERHLLQNTRVRYFLLLMNCSCKKYLYSIQLEMLCTLPVKSSPGCKISLYLHPSIYAINIDIGAESLLFPFGKKPWECCVCKQLLKFFLLSQIKTVLAFVFYSDLVKLCLYSKVKVRIETRYGHNELPG